MYTKIGVLLWFDRKVRSFKINVGPLLHVYFRKNRGEIRWCFRLVILKIRGRALFDMDTSIVSRIKVWRFYVHHLFWKCFTVYSPGFADGAKVYMGDKPVGRLGRGDDN